MTYSVLVIGSGGREHALARALLDSDEVDAVHVAPGNPGTAEFATNHDVAATSPLAVAELAERLGVRLVVVGPEAPLVAGVADAVRRAGILCFGPSQMAAELEGSKAFAKEVMAKAGVPTARAYDCANMGEVCAALDEFGPPYVVKDDGLAAGKGVVVTEDRDEATAHASRCGRVVVEEYLEGPEFSLFVVCDGVRGVPLLPAQDFKRVGEGDVGPNTGGMGAYAPLPWLPADAVDACMRDIVDPVLAEMASRGTPFQGLLFVGLAYTAEGPKVIEFNVRFGDPECQAVLSLLESPLADLLVAASTGRLDKVTAPRWRDASAVYVVIAADGYPEEPHKGGPIRVGEAAGVIHAGTAIVDGQLVAAGGRVLGVVAHGDDVATARERAYAEVDRIEYEQGFCRRDIAARVQEIHV